MRLSNIITSLLLPLSITAIRAEVENKCTYPIYYLSVIAGGQAVGSGIIPPGQKYSEESTAQGRAIKIVSSDVGWWTNAPQFIWGYSTDPSGTYTSISTVPRNASPLDGKPGNKKITLTGTGFNCPSITWSDGRDPGVDRVNNCRYVPGP